MLILIQTAKYLHLLSDLKPVILQKMVDRLQVTVELQSPKQKKVSNVLQATPAYTVALTLKAKIPTPNSTHNY